MAMASAAIPSGLRTSGLAVLTTFIGIAKMMSSLLFGWLWQTYGTKRAVFTFFVILVAVLLVVLLWLSTTRHEERIQ